MLSMIAVITLLLVSKHFVHGLLLFFFPANPRGELCILSSFLRKSTCPRIGGQSGCPGDLMSAHLRQLTHVYAPKPPVATGAVMTSFSIVYLALGSSQFFPSQRPWTHRSRCTSQLNEKKAPL